MAINPINFSTVPGAFLHNAMNPVSPETSIVYATAAESGFLAMGDVPNGILSRRVLVENRIAIAFDVLFDRVLLDLVDDLQNAWIDGDRPADEPSHMPEDYERPAQAFRLAVLDAEGLLDEVPSSLATTLDLARSFSDSAMTFAGLQSWTVKALDAAHIDPATCDTRPQACLILLGAQILWKMRIVRGAAISMADVTGALKRIGERTGSRGEMREEGFVRYARALLLLLNNRGDLDYLHAAREELERSIDCFRRTRGDFPFILYKRLSEVHELIGQPIATLPVARALPKSKSKAR